MIGFVGVGSMGLPIVQNILRSGRELSFFARRAEVIAAATAMGARFIPSIEELGQQCSTVVFFLNTAQQCRECLEKLLTQMRGGTLIIGSTLLPADCRELASLCREKQVSLLDAPVSGGVRGAQSGTLTVMVSGDKGKFEQCLPVFQCYGQKIVYVGEEAGMAQTLKAINQQLVGVNAAAVCEAYALGSRCGLDPEIIAQTIPFCAGSSKIFENRSRYILERNFEKRSSLQIQRKDLQICQRLASEAGMSLPVASACEKLYERALEFCDPSEDIIALLKVFEAQGREDTGRAPGSEGCNLNC